MSPGHQNRGKLFIRGRRRWVKPGFCKDRMQTLPLLLRQDNLSDWKPYVDPSTRNVYAEFSKLASIVFVCPSLQIIPEF